MYSVLNKGRALNLPVDILLELFDRMVVPVLTYGSEVWGIGGHEVLECIQLIYCKYVLRLKKKSTPTCLLYKELGKYPIDIRIKTNIINYRGRIVTSPKIHKLTNVRYKTIYELHTRNIFRSPWLVNVENILNQCGMTNAWQCQCQDINPQCLKRAVSNRLQEQFIQQNEITMSNKIASASFTRR